ncbi:GFA family protein [Pseudomonas sp. WS 5071]|uniref:GFA family protein n=1 Tax=Pseudomonas sp. WS 5071 TaxID=2717479 RepID=UPI0014766F41|nr:GFA family protein [Pseudomonas sp. WS 5071]NMY76870.1 GFA family protein [Pseudomonas sp. WS 5071]
MTEVYQGSCLCAAVRYELLDEPKAVSHCHCSQCRKGHGAAFASYGSVPYSAFSLLSCAEDLKAYRSSESVLREFCRHCGSTLFWKCSQGEAVGWICVALGTLDTPFKPSKQKHIYTGDSAIWFEAPQE